MSIVAADILIKGSVTTGAAGDSTAQTVAGSNLGKYMATTQPADATLNNLFPDTTGAENAASQVDYQCIFVHNSHATLTYQSCVVWVNAQVAGGVGYDIALDSTAVSAHGASSAQALTIANKNTAPAAITFAGTAVSLGTALSIGDLTPGQVKAVWLKRTAANTVAVPNDGATIEFSGDTL